jgi:hypothetical protein
MDDYAWRWPPASAAGAQKEADFVANKLIPKGLDGYIVDPESDQAGATNDWNRTTCAPFAKAFCSTIKNAAPASFVFGTTSGCAYPANNMKPNIPWNEFFSASNALYPQTYWRWTNPSTGQRGQKINGGTPQRAIDKGVPAWRQNLSASQLCRWLVKWMSSQNLKSPILARPSHT